MRFKYLIIPVFLAMLILLVISLFVKNNDIIPREVLFAPPTKTSVSFSPNGQYISYLAPKNGVLNIWLAPINDLSQATAITDDNKRGIRRYFWSYDNQHILYLDDNKGDENYYISSYNVNTKTTKLLTPKTGVKSIIYKTGRLKPNEILIGINERDKKYFDVYKINLIDSTKELVLENNKFSGFVFDNNFKMRFAIFINKNGDKEYYQQKEGNWKLFLTIPMEDTKTSNILGFDKTNRSIYLLDSRDSNISVLKTLDLDTNEYTTIAEDNRADIRVFTSHPTNKNIQAIVINYDKRIYKVLDDEIKDDIEYLQTIDSGNFNILSRSADDQIWLISYTNDVLPIKYYKYNRSKRKIEFLFNNKDDLTKYTLSPMHPVIIKSRDGLDLVSYLTLPAEKKLDMKQLKPSPLVLIVHGGPISRVSWGFDSMHQWLANRGYAALSVNFRGSSGFGKNFINAGNMEWGGKMQDDLIDAVHWSINNQISDPQKICILGGSYGGYATLFALTSTPETFACGIDMFGPSSLLTLVRNTPAYWKPMENDLKKRIGPWDTDKEKEFLKQRSPLTFSDKIKRPLLIAQGANDPRVTQLESDQIVQSMQSHNIPVIYALYKDEGHGFSTPKNYLSFLSIAEKFLANALGGKMEPMNNKDFTDVNFLLNGQIAVDKENIENIMSMEMPGINSGN